MPAAVKAYAESGSLRDAFEVQGEDVESYRMDFAKYRRSAWRRWLAEFRQWRTLAIMINADPDAIQCSCLEADFLAEGQEDINLSPQPNSTGG